MAHDRSGVTIFLAGVCFGAGLGLLLAPETGRELRELLREAAGAFKEEFGQRLTEAVQTALERGQEYLEEGRIG